MRKVIALLCGGRMEVERHVNNEEASHYQLGIFIGIKTNIGLVERCGKTEENDFVGRIFGNTFCV